MDCRLCCLNGAVLCSKLVLAAHSPLLADILRSSKVLKSPAVQVPFTLFLVPPKENVIIFGLYQIKSRLVLFIAL